MNRPFSGATGVAGSYPLHIAVGLHSRHGMLEIQLNLFDVPSIIETACFIIL